MRGHTLGRYLVRATKLHRIVVLLETTGITTAVCVLQDAAAVVVGFGAYNNTIHCTAVAYDVLYTLVR